MQERLAEIGGRIDQLNARARAGAAEAKSRIQPHVDALREQEKAAGAAVAKASDGAEGELEQLRTRADIAEHSLAADAADDRKKFADALEAELHDWDTYLERLQTKAATKAGTTREQAEGAIADLRERRNDVADRLGAIRTSSGDSWREQKKRITAARDEFERKADDLSAKFK